MRPGTSPLGILLSTAPRDVAVPAAYADLVDVGGGRLWLGECVNLDTYSVMTYLAGAGHRIPMGSSISLMALRHPYDLALRARSVASLTGRPFVVGIGTGSTEFVEVFRGERYRSPLTAVREYASTLRTLLDGHTPVGRWEYHGAAAPLTPLATPPVDVGVGVLRPGMAEVAGAVADAVVTWMTPPDYVRDTLLPAMCRGATAAGRRTPRVSTVLHVALDRPGRDRRGLIATATAGYLAAPHYADMLRRAGVRIDGADPTAALLDAGVFAFGSAEEVAATVTRYLHAGVDEVVLNAAGVHRSAGPRAAIADLAAMLPAIAPPG